MQADQPMATADLAALRKMHPGIITIRAILPELAEVAEERRLSEMSLTERFKLFVKRERGAEPPEELVKFFLEMVNEQGTGNRCRKTPRNRPGVRWREAHQA